MPPPLCRNVPEAGYHCSMQSFKTPQTLLETPWAVQSSGLASLPTELLLNIIGHADCLDQLSLALTCKSMLAISAMTIMMIPSAAEHREYRRCCSVMLGILQAVQPRELHGRPEKTWALCAACYRYRPKKKAYWEIYEKLRKGKVHHNLIGGYNNVVDVIDSWCARESNSAQCPECWCDIAIKGTWYTKPQNNSF